MLKNVSEFSACFFYGFSFKLVYNTNHEAADPGGHPFCSGPTPRPPLRTGSQQKYMKFWRCWNPKILEESFQIIFFHPFQFKDEKTKAQSVVVCLESPANMRAGARCAGRVFMLQSNFPCAVPVTAPKLYSSAFGRGYSAKCIHYFFWR